MAAQVLVPTHAAPPVSVLSSFRYRRPFDPADAQWCSRFSTERTRKCPLVLVAEDEPAICALAVRIIRGLGYGVVTAGDGEEAFELTLGHLPDLVLTDAVMPKLDGRDLCRRLKRDPRTSGIPVVVMTGLYTALPYRLEAHEVFKVDAFLNKPLDPTTLATALRTYLPVPMAVGA